MARARRGARPQPSGQDTPLGAPSVGSSDTPHRILLVVGDAQEMEADVVDALAVLGDLPHSVMVVNNAGARYLGRICYLATWHVEHVDKYAQARAVAGGNHDYTTISQFERPGVDHVPVWLSGGSGALYAVLAGLKLGFTRVVVAGVPLVGEYEQFQSGWHKSFAAIQHTVRAMSGFPRRLLGAPTTEWLTNN